MNLQSLFLKEKSFEGYDDNAVLECLLTTAGIRTDIPAMVDRMMDEFGSFKGILEAKPEQLIGSQSLGCPNESEKIRRGSPSLYHEIYTIKKIYVCLNWLKGF